jgi:glycoside/pentoside/hexuronide:cation symporter, GPH family
VGGKVTRETVLPAAVDVIAEKKATAGVDTSEDASRKEVALYAFGQVEGALTGSFYGVINNVLIMSMGINPVITGMLLGLKMLWDGITDPIMAHITDNARTRWGRRRPFILVGSVGCLLWLVAVVAFFPRTVPIEPNASAKEKKEMETVASVPPVTESQMRSVDSLAVAQQTGEKVKATAIPLEIGKKQPGMWATIANGWNVFISETNKGQRTIIFYVAIAFLVFTTLTTVMGVPYYALGIELSPSYDGRTRVVTYRSVIDKIGGLSAGWILPFCYLAFFSTVLDGLLWYVIITALIGIPSTIIMVKYTRERTNVTMVKTRINIFKSVWLTAKNVHFLKILALYLFFGFSVGIFMHIGLFLNVYWIYGGNKLAGAAMNSRVETMAWALTFAALPGVQWACRRYQKHVALRIAIIMMAAGSILKWWCMNPAHPEYQYILPFFWSIGIASLYTILATMMADVTDIDELATGTRREGMFGAVMAFIMKSVGTLQAILAGLVLAASGFKTEYGMHQPDEVIYRMRLLNSIIPGLLTLLGLVLLYRYPLTRKKMEEVKAKIKARKEAAAATAARAVTGVQSAVPETV